MSDFDDAIGDMVDDLLTEAGSSWTYRDAPGTGSADATVTARKSVLPPFSFEGGPGHIVEVRPIDFIMKTSALPFGEPVRGQRLLSATETYEVWSLNGEKCFRQISPQMTRIHTKRIE